VALKEVVVEGREMIRGFFPAGLSLDYIGIYIQNLEMRGKKKGKKETRW
jgi:hypothetical protein